MLPRSQPLLSSVWMMSWARFHSQKFRKGVKPLLIWQCRVTEESMNQQDGEILPQFTSDNVNPRSCLISEDCEICVPGSFLLIACIKMNKLTNRKTKPCPWKILTDSMFHYSEYTDRTTDRQTDRQTAGLGFYIWRMIFRWSISPQVRLRTTNSSTDLDLRREANVQWGASAAI